VEAEVGDQALGREENRVRGQADFDPVGLLRLVQCGIDFDARHEVADFKAILSSGAVLSTIIAAPHGHKP
jgi:hypothetical protein